MIGHTGFLVTARRLADGVTAPPRRRRPAKGAHPAAEAAQAATEAALPDQEDANADPATPTPEP